MNSAHSLYSAAISPHHAQESSQVSMCWSVVSTSRGQTGPIVADFQTD